MPSSQKTITHHTLKQLKQQGQRFVCLTAYDFTTAQLLDQAGVEALLVGDSLAMTVLGHANTLSITVDEMLHHVKAVTKAAKQAWVIADAPFLSYHITVEEGIRNCARLIQEGNAHAVKIEGHSPHILQLVARLTEIGIPVVGHLGLTPQALLQFGGFKLQAKTTETALHLIQHAQALQAAGACAVVLEMIPAQVAQLVSERLTIPTIGIGAGSGCDGQVLVIDDILGRFQGFTPKFVRRYAEFAQQTVSAVQAFQADVQAGTFPNNHTEATLLEPSVYQALVAELTVMETII